MDPIAISLTVAACVFAGALVGVFADRLLPGAHLTRETQDVIRLGVGMLSVLASLVLGLLIATAKSDFDTTDHEIRAYATDLIVLSETLRDYGDLAAVPRAGLRRFTAQMLADDWPPDGQRRDQMENHAAAVMLEHVRERVRALKPVDAGQQELKDQALQLSNTLLRQRWLLIEQEGGSVRPLVLAILVSWIVVIFVSFGLNAPRNGTVIGTFLICALAIGGSVFLIEELDAPLRGVLQVSSRPMANALRYMDGPRGNDMPTDSAFH